MKKNGFTLVELLVVIALLAAIVLMFMPNVIKIIKNSDTKVYQITEKDLIEKAKDYANYSKNYIKPTQEDPVKYIDMSTLVNENYMSTILDNKTGQTCSAYVKVTYNEVENTYEACLKCESYTTNNSFCEESNISSVNLNIEKIFNN